MIDDVRRWTCHACGTRVSSNSTGQVRDESGSHHNAGGERCIRVMQDRISLLHASLKEVVHFARTFGCNRTNDGPCDCCAAIKRAEMLVSGTNT